jgi:hydroxymethylpyrimidine pyrophosphatase-like HAD family hydrolase
VAFDLWEDGPPLSEADAGRILAILRDQGLTAARSSVHINTWVGGYGKREMVERVIERQFGKRQRAHPSTLLYVGDSRNDGPLFAYFPHSVGVANVAPLLGELRSLGQAPAYLTARSHGAGFAEVVERVLLSTQETRHVKRGRGGRLRGGRVTR